MTRPLLAVACVIFAATGASAQAGYIGIFSDPGGTDCGLVDAAPGLAIAYVVHVNTPGATASQFRVASGDGFDCIWLGDQSLFPIIIGNSIDGISIAYGSCLSSPIHILSINYFCSGLSATCSWLHICPDPLAPTGFIEVVDCNQQKLIASGGVLWVNPDWITCGCWINASASKSPSASPVCTPPVPVRQSTWGAVKSLYR